ncbi:MAG: FAD-dependent oxidoreductase, partial [Clostridiales bacterium]|nr:FAD-dependent oxidoreductase [Clostridiales bacterium]
SYKDAVTLREHIRSMFEKAAAEDDPEVRKRLLTFVVCGGGFTGVEMAGELGEAQVHLAEEYGINPKEVKIYNIEAMDRILSMLEDKKQIDKVEKRFKKLGIELLKNAPIVKAEENQIILKDGTIIPTSTLIWTAGMKNNICAESLGLTQGQSCRIVVNEYMQTSDYKNVFAVGDNSYYEDEKGVMPQIVEAAEQSGHTAALNVAALIKGTELHTHKQNYHGFMVSIGSRYAVADNNGLRTSGFIAMSIKHLVNFFYLFMVSGLRQLWNYLLHEFFHIENRRSFVGGHFSKRTPNFWLVPFRLWLGYMWFIEGVKKIGEGWLKEPKMFASTVADAVSSASDAVASASQAVVETVTSASPVTESPLTPETYTNLPGFVQWTLDHMPHGWGEPLLEVPGFMQWIIDNIVAPNAVPIQTVMVVAEILLGLALIGGLFTFLASIVSVGMVVGIALTGMADASILWFLFGGIATIGGSGSTFGLDYYVLPVLKRWWKKTRFARKSYLYFD